MEDTVRVHHKETGISMKNLMVYTRRTDYCRALVNTTLDLQVHKPCSFSLLPGVDWLVIILFLNINILIIVRIKLILDGYYIRIIIVNGD